MVIELIFDDWKKFDKEKGIYSVYGTEEGLKLTMGDFHSGSTFSAVLLIDHEQEAELKKAIRNGYKPIFEIALPTKER